MENRRPTPHSWDGLGLGLLPSLESHNQVACIFAFNGHWALLWGAPSSGRFHWVYSYGLPNHVLPAARHLAGALSDLLGLDFVDFTAFHPLRQQSATTCGTIALLHADFVAIQRRP